MFVHGFVWSISVIQWQTQRAKSYARKDRVNCSVFGKGKIKK